MTRFQKRGHHIAWQAACHKHFNGFFVCCENMYHSLKINWTSWRGHLISFPCIFFKNVFIFLCLTLNGSGKYPNLTVSLDQTWAVHSVSHVNAETLPRLCMHAKHTAYEVFQKPCSSFALHNIFTLQNSLGTHAKHKHKHKISFSGASSNVTHEVTQLFVLKTEFITSFYLRDSEGLELTNNWAKGFQNSFGKTLEIIVRNW